MISPKNIAAKPLKSNFSSVALFTLSAITLQSSPASSVTIGAYAVANHSNCGAGNIPGTIAELDKFFDSSDLPSDFQKNFYWKDARVKQSEWIKEGDYQASSETNFGFDGSDASVLTYIASHGVTSSGVYKALAGSRNFGGCYIPTTSLELGNNASRYTILSTCQGLKIGTGDYPTSPGENPSKTWKNSAKGLNCIFGYSNNMADDDMYGVYLLANLKDGRSSLSKAFMDASESVSQDNIPAVLCYGASEQDAGNYIESNSSFESQPRPNAASAWVYRMMNPVTSVKSLNTEIPAVLRIAPKNLNVEKIARIFLGNSLTKSGSAKNTKFSSNSGSVSYDLKTGTLRVQNLLIEAVKNDDVPSLNEAEQIARHALKVSGLGKIAGDLTLSATGEEMLGGAEGIKRILSRQFTYKQNLAGATSLSQQGSIDVTVGPGGAITQIRAALLDIDSTFKAPLRPTTLGQRSDAVELLAIESVASKAPGASYKVIKQRIGYDAGNFHKSRVNAPAVIEVTVEAAQGEFKRNYVQKITL